MDALTQLVEAFVTPFASPVTDALCREGLHRVSRSLKRAVMDGQDSGAREDMCIASLFGGMALANAKLGAVHGIAAPLGGMIDASHGQICARFLAPVAALNILRLGQVDSGIALLEKYREVAVILTRSSAARPEDGVEMIKDLVNALEIPCLKGRGLDIPGCRILAEKAMAASSMKGNPVALTLEEILDLVSGEVGVSPE
jgi:alcohol dehydrogenase class IV